MISLNSLILYNNYSDVLEEEVACSDHGSIDNSEEQQNPGDIDLKIRREQKQDVVSDLISGSLETHFQDSEIENPEKEKNSPHYIELKKVLALTKVAGNVLGSTPNQIYMIGDNKENDSLFGELEIQIGIDNLTLVKSYIQEHGVKFFKKVLEKKDGLVYELNNGMGLFFKASGKIYLQTKELGRGKQKVTKLNILVASCKSEHLAKDKLIFRAFTAPIPEVPSTDLDTPKEIKRKEKLLEQNQQETYFNRFLKQASKFFDLSHVNVIKSISSMDEVSGTMNELFDCDVDMFLKNNKNLSPKELLSIAKQAAEGISQLHRLKVLHRDIKPDNFLIKRDENEKFVVKVTDFGLSTGIKGLKNKSKALFAPILDPYLVETNFSSYQIYSTSLDIYQLGMTLTMILTGTPLGEFNEMRKMDQELKGFSSLQEWKRHPERWGIMDKIGDEETKKLLIKMLHPTNPNERPNIDEVVAYLNEKSV